MAQQVNLSDVAEATGVSRATVSKALNGWPDVSPSTRQRIIRAARKLNYPLGQVRSGRRAAGKRIQRVGLVCFDHTIEEMLANQT
jgi:LacI family transcriptional regulator